MIFFGDRNTVAVFASDLILRSKIDSASITIMVPGKSGASFALIVTGTSSDDIVVKTATNYCWQPTNILRARAILAG